MTMGYIMDDFHQFPSVRTGICVPCVLWGVASDSPGGPPDDVCALLDC